MRRFLSFIILIYSAGVFAQRIDLCPMIKLQSSRSRCHMMLGDQYLDSEAARVCDQIKAHSERLRCGLAIAGKIYSPSGVYRLSEVDRCATLGETSAVINCFVQTGTPLVQSEEYPGAPATRSVCEAMQRNVWRNECYLITDKKIVDPIASNYCAMLMPNEARFDCATVIAGKRYRIEDLRECGIEEVLEKKIACFRRKGF